MTFKNFNIADWFSFYRIAAVPILLLLLYVSEREIFSLMLLISYLTDMIDGYLARKLKISSPRGSQLDSIGDQATFIMGLMGLTIFEWEFMKENYLLILFVLSIYFFQMILAFRKYNKATAFHTYLAKFSAFLQGVFVLWFLFFGPRVELFYAVIIIGILETIEEIILIFMFNQWTHNVKGIYWVLREKKRKENNRIKLGG